MKTDVFHPEYRSPKGIASFWPKDGLWHIALPAVDPDPVTGLSNGGFLWAPDSYPDRNQAVAVIEEQP